MIETVEKTRNIPAPWKADAVLALVALLWGTTFVVVKQALGEISTLYFLFLRFSLATVFMLPGLVPVWRQERARIWRGLLGGAIAGIFLWLGYVLQTVGLRYTSAGNSGFLTGLYIVLVPLFSAVLYRRWPQWAELVGIAVATIGIVLLTFPSLDRNFQLNRGDLLTIGCAVVFAGHLLVLGYYSKRERFEAVAVGQIACVAFLSFAGLPFDAPTAHWSNGLITAIILTGVFATAGAFVGQTWAQQYTTATRAALLFALEPVFSLVTAILIGGEHVTLTALAGGALILLGILAVELRKSAEPEAG